MALRILASFIVNSIVVVGSLSSEIGERPSKGAIANKPRRSLDGYWGYIGIMEKIMEATILLYRGYM